MTLAEANRRLALSIHRQLAGEIPNVFGGPCRIMVHGFIIMEDGAEWLHVATPLGIYGIDDAGVAHEARPKRLN